MLPQNRGVSKFDLKLFVAIDAVKFREIVARLSDYNGPIFATASTSQVKFYGRTAEGEIIGATLLTAEIQNLKLGNLSAKYILKLRDLCDTILNA
uniref:Uncharacterized protein n=1 Tax=Cucumis sativus TaxID=3659 RepID=A0A0A0K9X2_CUCSA